MAESKFVLMALLEVENTKIEKEIKGENQDRTFFLLFLIAFNVHKNHFS